MEQDAVKQLEKAAATLERALLLRDHPETLRLWETIAGMSVEELSRNEELVLDLPSDVAVIVPDALAQAAGSDSPELRSWAARNPHIGSTQLAELVAQDASLRGVAAMNPNAPLDLLGEVLAEARQHLARGFLGGLFPAPACDLTDLVLAHVDLLAHLDFGELEHVFGEIELMGATEIAASRTSLSQAGLAAVPWTTAIKIPLLADLMAASSKDPAMLSFFARNGVPAAAASEHLPPDELNKLLNDLPVMDSLMLAGVLRSPNIAEVSAPLTSELVDSFLARKEPAVTSAILGNGALPAPSERQLRSVFDEAAEVSASGEFVRGVCVDPMAVLSSPHTPSEVLVDLAGVRFGERVPFAAETAFRNPNLSLQAQKEIVARLFEAEAWSPVWQTHAAQLLCNPAADSQIVDQLLAGSTAADVLCRLTPQDIALMSEHARAAVTYLVDSDSALLREIHHNPVAHALLRLVNDSPALDLLRNDPSGHSPAFVAAIEARQAELSLPPEAVPASRSIPAEREVLRAPDSGHRKTLEDRVAEAGLRFETAVSKLNCEQPNPAARPPLSSRISDGYDRIKIALDRETAVNAAGAAAFNAKRRELARAFCREDISVADVEHALASDIRRAGQPAQLSKTAQSSR